MKDPRARGRGYQVAMATVCAVLSGAGFFTAGAFAQISVPAQAAVAPAVAAESWTGSPVGSPLSAKLGFASVLVLAQSQATPSSFNFPDPGSVPGVVGTMSATVQAAIIKAAYQGLGHPYVWGGTSFQNGWDCSGFVQWAYRQAGLQLPRTEQWEAMVPTSTPQPGDLVVQNSDGPNHWAHVGIYVGDGKMISALNPGVGTVLLPTVLTEAIGKSMYFTMVDPEAAKDPGKATDPATDKTPGSPTASPSSPSGTPPASPSPSGTATPTPTPTSSATSTPTSSPSQTATPTPSGTATATPPPSATPTSSPSATAAPDPTKTATPTPSPLETATPTATPSPTATAAPTPTPDPATVPSAGPSAVATASETATTPAIASAIPLAIPSASPPAVTSPTADPGATATASPTASSSATPSGAATPSRTSTSSTSATGGTSAPDGTPSP